jgi:hypothetical protein
MEQAHVGYCLERSGSAGADCGSGDHSQTFLQRIVGWLVLLQLELGTLVQWK